MASPYVIRISSQKGGVGKTTVAVNLAVILQDLGYKTLLMDADFANPSVGFHIGMEDVNIGFKDVIKGKVALKHAIAIHGPTGLHVLPGKISRKPYLPTPTEVSRMNSEVKNSSYMFVVIDTSPGFFIPEIAKLTDEALILTTPEMSACASSIRLAEIYNQSHMKHSLVINRVRNKRYELHIGEIEEMYGDKAAGVLPEDDIVPESIAIHIPAILLSRNCMFSRRMSELSRFYATRQSVEAEVRGDGGILGFLRRLFGRG